MKKKENPASRRNAKSRPKLAERTATNYNSTGNASLGLTASHMSNRFGASPPLAALLGLLAALRSAFA
jgi:hypothetical protein